MAFAAFNALESSVSPLVKRVLSHNTDSMNPQEQGPTLIEGAQKALDDAASSTISASAKSGESGLIVQTVQSATSVYNKHADVIGSASDAMKDLMQGEIVKKTPNDLLVVAKKMTSALDVVTEDYPIVGVAAVAFKVIVNLELQRRENDRRVGSMLVKASDMMSIFLQLKDVKDPSIKGAHGETLEGRLQGVIKNIAQDVHDCGIAIDKYWKSKFIVRLFRSEHWADEFLSISDGFSKRKEELKLALDITEAVKVDTMIDKMDQLIRMQSERELKFEKEVKQRGGREKCLESPDQLGELLDTSELLEGRPQSKSRTDGRSASEQNHVDVSLLLHEIQTPLQTLLEENRASFTLAFDKQSSLITDSISSSEARIMRAINSNNIFQQVKDPHLQCIWEQMKWRPVVKTEYFIAELHDYFVNRFSSIHRDARLAQVKFDASSLSVPVQSQVSDPDSEVEDHKLPAIDPADEWCLKYLTNLYIPGLCESFNSDANRLVSIREVNTFTSAIPPDWSLLQTLVYGAAGWWVDSQYYCICIQNIMESMVKVQLGALPENRRYIARYLDSFAIKDVTLLIRSLAEVDSDDPDLTRLAARRRKAQEDDLEAKLNSVKHCIDSTDAVKHFGSGRIENSLLPLLYLVLKRHLQIMKVASTVILDEKELHFATQSIQNIFGGVDLRVKQLEVIFRQQGTDPKMRFAWYSHGLYNIWFNPDLNLENTEDGAWVTDDCGFDDAKLEIDTSILKLGPSSLTEANEQLEKPVQLVLSNSGQESQSTKEEFIRLWCLNELQKGCWTIPYDDTPICITPDEKRRFDSLSKELPPADVQCWSSLAELHLRTRTTSTYCDACHWPIIDAIHHCIDCENDNYNLCVECESLAVSNHKYTSKHKATHNMLVFRVRRPQVLRRQAILDARKILSTLSLVKAPSKGLLPTGDDPSETKSANKGTCAECGMKLLNGVFYVCLVCELEGNKDQVTMCHDCAFRDTKKHDETHHLLKIKDRVQDTDGTSGEPIEGVESSALSSLSSRVDALTAMVESRFVELDRRLAELMEKVQLSFGSVS